MISPAGNAHMPLVVLIGPTAIGKTALSLKLAATFEGEIVSADSRLVYRGMDIGVAKPTSQEQALVPHHLIDLVEPSDTLSLAFIQRAAYAAIGDIQLRQKLPILVGGTGQYVSAIIEGWGIPEVPPNENLRAELEQFAAVHGAAGLWDRLAQHDPTAASRIHPNNIRRVIRALEVFLETGQPITELQRKHPPAYDILQLGLTCPREILHTRIDTRIDAMLANGLVDEVQRLVEAGYDRTTPSMSGLGYRQIMTALSGECTLDEAVDMLRRATRDFARRQDVWFRKYNPSARWYDMTETNPETIVEYVRVWLGNRTHGTH